MKPKRWSGYALGVVAGLAVLTAGAARAVTITVVPDAGAPSPLALGDTITLTLEVTDGLAAGSAPSLMAFSLDLAFDASVLTLVGPGPSDPPDPLDVFVPFPAGTVLCVFPPDASCDALVDLALSPGLLTLDAASLVAPADVNASQPATGPIAMLEFQVIGADPLGTTALTFADVDLSGTTVAAPTTVGTLPGTGVGVELGVPTVAVPEPASAAILALGLFVLALRYRSA